MDEYLWNGYVPQRNFIFDLSQLTIIEREGFVEDFCKALMHQQALETTNRLKYFLIFEEAHVFFPQGCMTARAHKNAIYMMTQGRNYNVRFACITQFASILDKKAMRYMRQRYFGATDEPNDVRYIEQFFPRERQSHNVQITLEGLGAGQFLYKFGKHSEIVEITPFLSETKPKLAEVPQRAPIAPTADTRQYQNTGGNAIATARLAFVILFALALLWIMANMRK
jgi:hypothetical protein